MYSVAAIAVMEQQISLTLSMSYFTTMGKDDRFKYPERGLSQADGQSLRS
jgi:hypothetical protein